MLKPQENLMSPEDAEKEAAEMQEKISSGEAKDYNEAEKIIELEKLEAQVVESTIESLKEKDSAGVDDYADLLDVAVEIARQKAEKQQQTTGKEPDLTMLVDEIRFELMYKVDAQLGRFERLQKRISSEKPEEITSTWVQRRDIVIYRHLTRLYKDAAGEINWPFITEKIGISDIFKFNRYRDWRNPEILKREIKKLEEALAADEKANPDYFIFNTETIKRHSSALHDAAKRLYREEQTGNTQWESLIKNMSPAWQKKWNFHKNEKIDPVAVIKKKLEESQPDKFNPKWLEENSKAAYNHITAHYRMENEEGKEEVDWGSFLADLGGDWAGRFRKAERLSFEKAVPEKQYENPEEITNVEKYFEGTYYLASIMTSADNPKERQMQNEIFEKLIELAQAGNVLAEQRIIQHAQDLAAEWGENHKKELRSRLQFADPEELKKVYRECIYLYDHYRDRYAFAALVFQKLERLLRQQDKFAFGRSFDASRFDEEGGRKNENYIGRPDAHELEEG